MGAIFQKKEKYLKILAKMYKIWKTKLNRAGDYMQ